MLRSLLGAMQVEFWRAQRCPHVAWPEASRRLSDSSESQAFGLRDAFSTSLNRDSRFGTGFPHRKAELRWKHFGLIIKLRRDGEPRGFCAHR